MVHTIALDDKPGIAAEAPPTSKTTKIKERELKKKERPSKAPKKKKSIGQRTSLSDLVDMARDINIPIVQTNIDIEDLSTLLKDIEDSYSSLV